MSTEVAAPVVEYQSRFVAYAKAHGLEPEKMIESDRKRWPGGAMCGFILWLGSRWAEWGSARGLTKIGGGWLRNKRYYLLSQEDHNSFDAWLISATVQ